ncbi:MAG: sirohydrochlorin cobaltochelatase [Desulfocapsaceae bacterium]|nr:sirohydrochlorin cobaltochelatase [Desulfocapsaceae bacterium]
MNSVLRSIPLTFLCLFLFISSLHAQETAEKDTNAIVIATFGTTVPSALPGILHIRDRMQKRFPGTEVRIAFTSNMIRKVWHKRQHDEAFKKANPTITDDIFYVKGPLATIADLQDEGFSTILVQPGHISLGEEYMDLVSYINGLNAITTIKEKNRPFLRLAISRPALGTMGPKHPYSDDINEVAKSLAADIGKAREAGAALLYMAHGNDFFPSSGAYLQLVDVLRMQHPETKTYIASVEGFPSLETTIREMKEDKVQKVILKPLMDVAGDHAHNDMAGGGPDSMKSILIKNGFQVTTVIEGMGEQDGFADVFVNHLAQTAVDFGVTLK